MSYDPSTWEQTNEFIQSHVTVFLRFCLRNPRRSFSRWANALLYFWRSAQKISPAGRLTNSDKSANPRD